MPNPKIVEVVSSGVPELVREVRIYDTTIEHIKKRHKREYERWPEVVRTIKNPTRVHKSKTHSSAIVFVNDSATSGGGNPLRVPIKVYDSGIGIMSTAHFSSSRDQGELLWSRSDAQ